MCTVSSHLRRRAAAADAVVAAYVVARLDRDDAADLLAPPARPGVDVAALKDKAAQLEAIGKRQARMHAVGDITDAEYVEGARARKARLADIAAQLAPATATDPLAESRDQPAAQAVWDALPPPRKRAVARLLVKVTLLPTGRHGSRFDPDSVRVEPAA